jgi:hypothetical protein
MLALALSFECFGQMQCNKVVNLRQIETKEKEPTVSDEFLSFSRVLS